MAKRILPVDQNSFPIPALSYGTTVSLAYSGTSARVQLPMAAAGKEDVLRLASNTGCYLAFGDDTVTATTSDVYFPGGVETIKVPDGAEYVAAIQDSGAGTLTVTEMV